MKQTQLKLKKFKLPLTKRSRLALLAASILIITSLSYIAISNRNSSTTTPESNIKSGPYQLTPPPKTDTPPANTQPSSPSTSKPAAPTKKPAAPADLFSCASKTSDNSYHYCVINISGATTVNVQITLDSHAPANSGFIDWLDESQVACTHSTDCTVSESLLASGSLTSSNTIQTTTQTKMTVKALNYLTAKQCGIGCAHPVPREQYSFSGFTTATNNSLTLSYKYQCTHTYTADTNNEYPWLPGIKPTGCNP